jgi:hypothetical protein
MLKPPPRGGCYSIFNAIPFFFIDIPYSVKITSRFTVEIAGTRYLIFNGLMIRSTTIKTYYLYSLPFCSSPVHTLF